MNALKAPAAAVVGVGASLGRRRRDLEDQRRLPDYPELRGRHRRAAGQRL